jgi:hypothetical protein
VAIVKVTRFIKDADGEILAAVAETSLELSDPDNMVKISHNPGISQDQLIKSISAILSVAKSGIWSEHHE